ASATGLTAALRPAPGAAAAVRWLERRGKKIPNVSAAAVPLDLAPLLKENLFDRVETVILTSATLAAGGEFGYLEERLGLDLPPSRVAVREVLPSPFDFPSQCLFAIPTDLPAPRDAEARHRFILGRRRRAGPRAAGAHPREAALQGAERAPHRRAARAPRGEGVERLQPLSRAERGAQVETGIRPADPQQNGRRRRNPLG